MVDLAERSLATLPAATSPPRPSAPRLPVRPELRELLPDGLRRGSTVSVTGSVSLLLALLAAPSAAGAWCVLVDLPAGSSTRLSAEAARDLGIDLSRLPLVAAAGREWATVVGALLDAFDVVAARPPARLADGDLRRLAARARARGAILMPFFGAGARWPLADLRLESETGAWSGIGDGYGRLRQRRMTVTVGGRGQGARQRSVALWLPGADGGIAPCAAMHDDPVAPVVRLAGVRKAGAR